MKKLLVLAVAALMLAVPLFGCSSAPAPTTAATAEPTVAASESPTEPPKEDGPYAKYDPEIDVNFALSAGLDPKFPEGQDYNNNIWLTEF
jgi:flagellar basal body-associated protein FliL